MRDRACTGLEAMTILFVCVCGEGRVCGMFGSSGAYSESHQGVQVSSWAGPVAEVVGLVEESYSPRLTKNPGTELHNWPLSS